MVNILQRLNDAVNAFRGRSKVMPASSFFGFKTMTSQSSDFDYIKDGYKKNDIVYSIVNIILDKVVMPKWAVYKIKDEKKFFEYQLQIKALVSGKGDLEELRKKAMELKEEALVLDESNNKLSQLLAKPNELESWSEYIRNGAGYQLLTGNTYIYGKLLDAGANEGMPDSLNVMPSNCMSIFTDGLFPIGIEKYQLNAGQQLTFEKKEMLHFKQWNPEYSLNGSHLIGLAPLEALKDRIRKNNSGIASQKYAFDNQGIAGVAYLEDETQEGATAAAALKNRWDNEIWKKENKGAVMWTNTKTGYTQIGQSPADLAVLESEKSDVNFMCAAFQVPPILIYPDKSSYNNLKTAEKSLTLRAALPLLIGIRDAHNRKLKDDWGFGNKNLVIDFDLSVFSELQEDMKDMVDWLNKAWWIPIEEKYKIMGKPMPDYVDEETSHQIFIPSNMTSADLYNADLGNGDPLKD